MFGKLMIGLFGLLAGSVSASEDNCSAEKKEVVAAEAQKTTEDNGLNGIVEKKKATEKEEAEKAISENSEEEAE